jgi:hypothetical protein
VSLAELCLEVIPSDGLCSMHGVESIPPSPSCSPETVGGIRHPLTVFVTADQFQQVLNGADPVVYDQGFSSLDEGWRRMLLEFRQS